VGGSGVVYWIHMRQIATNIVLDPKIKFGKPVIKGTRVPVDLIVGKIAGGMDIAEVAQEYGLAKNQVLAALRYAQKVISEETLISY